MSRAYHFLGITFGDFKRILESEGVALSEIESDDPAFTNSDYIQFAERETPTGETVRKRLPKLADDDEVSYNVVRAIGDAFNIPGDKFGTRIF